jgi:hypothetical protein
MILLADEEWRFRPNLIVTTGVPLPYPHEMITPHLSAPQQSGTR